MPRASDGLWLSPVRQATAVDEHWYTGRARVTPQGRGVLTERPAPDLPLPHPNWRGPGPRPSIRSQLSVDPDATQWPGQHKAHPHAGHILARSSFHTKFWVPLMADVLWVMFLEGVGGREEAGTGDQTAQGVRGAAVRCRGEQGNSPPLGKPHLWSYARPDNKLQRKATLPWVQLLKLGV